MLSLDFATWPKSSSGVLSQDQAFLKPSILMLGGTFWKGSPWPGFEFDPEAAERRKEHRSSEEISPLTNAVEGVREQAGTWNGSDRRPLAKHPGRRWNGFPFRACARAPAEAKLFAVYVTVVVRVCSSVQSQSRIDVWYHRSVCSLA